MFGKLKNKLKEWTKKVSEVDEEPQETEDLKEIPKKEIIKEEKNRKTEEKPEKKKKIKDTKKEKPNTKKEKEEPQRKTPEEIIEEKSDFSTETENEELAEESEENKKGFFKKLFSKKEKTKEDEEDQKLPTDEELKEEVKKEKYNEPEKEFNVGLEKVSPNLEKTQEKAEEKGKKSSFFSKKKTISAEEFEEHAEDLEMILLENNVALEVVDKILEEIKEKIVGIELSKKQIIEKVTELLSEKIKEVLIEPFDIEKEIEKKEGPYVILFCGINGTGKTTTISKIANMFKEKGKSVVMAAGDTFRAAAVEQLKEHGKKLDIKVISHDYGADPAAVGFDAVKYAQKNKTDIVLIDTAGRIHTATNLIKEMEKIKRVCKPDRTLFVGESITGNDAVDQVKAFNDNIGIDGIVLSKADIDEKGGTALSVGYVTNKPIIFIGTGQGYKDIEKFNKEKFLEKLDLE